MSSLQSIERTATIAWCPTPNANGQPVLASGTVAGALDSSFDSSCQLDIFELSLDGSKAQQPVVSVKAPSRFHRLGWSGHKEGCVVGALEDGSVGFWNSARLLGGDPNPPVLLKKGAHSGPVRGLAVNPIDAYLVASGSVDAEVLIWDMNEFKSYMPGSKSTRLGQVTDLAWNLKHPSILATASANGFTTVWDLRHKREIVQLPGKSSVSAIAWSPDEATSIATASDDNSSPVISLWDLRNANAPDKQLSGGHEKGVLSLAWCPQDSDLLLSSGKDNRIAYWNPKTCTQLGHAEASGNWIYDLTWWPRNPDLFAAASFDGNVNVYSFQSLSSLPPAAGAGSDLFGPAATSTQSSAAADSVKQIPKWLKRPVTASFGFGGKLYTASGKKSCVVSGAGELGLDNAVTLNKLSEYCLARSEKDPKAKVFWTSMAAICGESGDYRKSILKMFGITIEPEEKDEEEKAVVQGEQQVEQLTASMSGSSPFSSAGDFDALANSAPVGEEVHSPRRRRSTFCGEPFHLYPKEASKEDRDITRAIIAGKYSEAVDLCVRADRLSDALLVAVCGGPALVAKTQRLYFQKVNSPYLRIVSGIVKKDLADVVENADLADWRDIMALICAKAEAHEFALLCGLLADRLAKSGPEDEHGAVLGYVLGGDALKAAALLLRSAKRGMSEAQGSAVQYSAWLESLVDRVRTALVLAGRNAQRQVTLGDLVGQVPELYRYFLLYSFVLEERGCAGMAADILGMIGVKAGAQGPFQEALQAFGYRLGQLTGQQVTANIPFELVDVQAEPAAPVAPAPTSHYQQQKPTQSSSPYYSGQQQQQQQAQYDQSAAYSSHYGGYNQNPSYSTQPSYYGTGLNQPSSAGQPAYATPAASNYQSQPTNAYGQSGQTYSQSSTGYGQQQPVGGYGQQQPVGYGQQQAVGGYGQPSTFSAYGQQQQQHTYSSQAFEVPKPSIPVPGPVSISPTPVTTIMNASLPSTAPMNAPGVTTGGFNDAPLVQPKISKQAPPITSPVRVSPVMPTITQAMPPTHPGHAAPQQQQQPSQQPAASVPIGIHNF